MPENTTSPADATTANVAALVGELSAKLDNLATKDEVKHLNEQYAELSRKVSDTTITVRDFGDEFGWNRRYKSLRNFSDAESAYTFGMLVMAGIAAQQPRYVDGKLAEKAANFLKGRSELIRGQREDVDTLGGYLVPEAISATLIDLREQYGVMRQLARVEDMSSDTTVLRRRASGLTAYFVGEATAPTQSTKSWNLVRLTAKKLATLTPITSELNEDAVLNIGDDLAGEIAYAFAEKEDDCGLNGDGTSAYGGITGIVTRLSDINGVDDGGGLVLADGNLFSEFTLANFHSVVGRIPQYADGPATCWVCHRTVWASVMQRLAYAAGGNDVMSIASGAGPTFLGYPVKFSQKMPSTNANSQIAVLFGDFTKAVTFGNRRGIKVDFSTERYFDTDELAVRGTSRFDIVAHDLGTSTVAGPVVGLISAAS